MPVAGRRADALANYAASAAFIGFGVWFYTVASRYHVGELANQLSLSVGGERWTIRTAQALEWLAMAYAVVLLPYYALQPKVVSKARILFEYLWGQFFVPRRPLTARREQQAALVLLLKFFFVPLMVNWLIGNTAEVLEHWRALEGQSPGGAFLTTFNSHLYLLVFKLLLMVDVFLFTIGYVIEIPRLRNEIRSVDPTASGWLVCIACYPPFNQAVTAFFPWQSSDFPSFSNPQLHVALNCLILLAMAVFAWASVALGLRASNLTNRGIVERGPYAWVRHPAYVAKNCAWWIGALPALGIAFGHSFAVGLLALGCVAAWSALYVLRALTEERHLLMIDNGYAQYMARVRYRFLPRLI
jgi:protein-S-isoprenylcysteine O-methyltransferase Ste14